MLPNDIRRVDRTIPSMEEFGGINKIQINYNKKYMSKSLLKILSILALGIAFTGCVKKDTYFSYDQSTANRKQTVKIANGGDLVVIARDVNPTIDTFTVIDLRREPNSAAELNQPLTVKLVKDP